MTCPQCQQVLAADVRFCSSCGFEITAANMETEIIVARDTADESRASDPLLGKVLDSKYELLARLGSGGAGTVYHARRLHIGDEVAVKVLNQDYVLDESAIERFRREARSAAMIRHANVVTIHDFSESKSGEPAYIVMELKLDRRAQRAERACGWRRGQDSRHLRLRKHVAAYKPCRTYGQVDRHIRPIK